VNLGRQCMMVKKVGVVYLKSVVSRVVVHNIALGYRVIDNERDHKFPGWLTFQYTALSWGSRAGPLNNSASTNNKDTLRIVSPRP